MGSPGAVDTTVTGTQEAQSLHTQLYKYTIGYGQREASRDVMSGLGLGGKRGAAIVVACENQKQRVKKGIWWVGATCPSSVLLLPTDDSATGIVCITANEL
ncbi:hypothetical protein ACLB2K_056220 [Fragaria x ananassa]